ncbi:O-antigen polymerase [Enterococcus gallinarum]|uniref:O-antigen polymerase n=1 Tax=Enterococcus gallinarum TaxID=1353 RepID=UPI001C3E6776|nr:O-antigen polymerase [Enterococcus gallinarum]
MIQLLILTISFIILFEIFITKNFLSPIVLFSSLFLLIITLAFFNLDGMYQVTMKSFYIVFIGVLSFSFGSYFYRLIYVTSKQEKTSKNFLLKRKEFNFKFLYLLAFFVSLGNIISAFYAFMFIKNGGSYFAIRQMILGYNDADPLIKNPLFNILSSYISGPGLFALIPFAMLFLLKKEHIKFSGIVFMNLFFSAIYSGGRIILIYTLVQLLILFKWNNIKLSRKMRRSIIAISLIAIVIIIIISDNRSSNSLLKSFYRYFSGPMALLSYWTNYADVQNINSYGLSFFYPFSYMINAFFNFWGMPNNFLHDIVLWQGMPQNVWVQVFPDQSMNAFSTLFYFFYQDFREFGVFIFSLIFGFISEFVFNKAFHQRNEKYLLIYLLGVKALVGSFIIWQLGSTSFFLSLVLMIVCLNKDKKINLRSNK